MGALKIRGILTPVCAASQNDRLVTTPSEFQPRSMEQNRNGIDTGGTPGLRMTVLLKTDN